MGSVTEQSVMGVIRAARPSFRNSHDKVAFAVHASFLASGFLLQATGPPAFSDDVLSSTSAVRKAELESEMIPRPAKLAPDFRNLMNQVQVLLFLLFLWWGRWSLSWASGWSLPKGQFWWTWQHPYRPK